MVLALWSTLFSPLHPRTPTTHPAASSKLPPAASPSLLPCAERRPRVPVRMGQAGITLFAPALRPEEGGRASATWQAACSDPCLLSPQCPPLCISLPSSACVCLCRVNGTFDSRKAYLSMVRTDLSPKPGYPEPFAAGVRTAAEPIAAPRLLFSLFNCRLPAFLLAMPAD